MGTKRQRIQQAAYPLHGVSARTRLGLLVTIVAVLTLAFFVGVGLAHGTAWVFSSEAGHLSNEAEAESPNACEGVVGIPFGTDPGWIRVGGSTLPSTPFVEARGQILQASQSGKTNPFLTHTDAPFNHYSKDINAFITLDDSYRHLLSEGNFEEGDENEHGVMEIEWERGGIPLFAFPSAGDRMTVWGPHIWDCGHGDTWFGGDDTYRTEIHPPVGWVMYRQTADADGAPQGDKREQDPWKYYESTDLDGIGTTLPSTALKNTVVQATVADAFFSSFGGNVPEALNGCDTDFVDCEQDNEWRQSLLQQDYAFFVPAPPKPDPAAQLVWESEDRCGEVPNNPGNPPGDDVEDVGEADDSAENIGAPTCNIPHEVAASTDAYGRPGILVTVKANSGGVTYPANEFVVFAKRYKVAWDWVPTAAQRAKTFKVDLNHIKVYDDSEPCGEDGEWVMSIRVNEAWIHPVRGLGDDDDPFWDDGAIDDDKCIINHDPTYRTYTVGETRTVSVVNGRSINIWSRTYDVDTFANDVLPVINVHRSGAGTFDDGVTDHDVEGAHTLNYTIADVTPATPSLGTLMIGNPKYGPNDYTGGSHTRIAASTTISLQGSDGAELQYRLWKDGDPTPAAWAYDADLSFALGTASGDGRYTIEYAPVSAGGIVAERRIALVELDTTAPVITLPAPITVFADQTAGKVVNYSALATDNLPGPVTFSCTPASGSLFPNGTNAPLATTVACSATDAVDNNAIGTFTVTVVSPFGYVPDFVVIGKDWATVGSGAIVQSGNVGVFDQSAGVPMQPGFEIIAGPSAQFLGGSQVAAHSDRVEASTKAGDVFYVDQYFTGNAAILTPKVGYVPLFYALPLFPSFTAGGGNVTLSGTTSLAPGTYGKLTVGPHAAVTVSGGLYSFSGIEVKSGATLQFAAPTTIRVTGRTLIGNGTTLMPGTGSGVTAHDVMLFAAGVDGPPNKPAHAIAIGSNVTLALNAYAPSGTLSLGSYSVVTGAFIGMRVLVGGNVTLNEDSAFLSP